MKPICDKCKKELSPESRYCYYCGEKVNIVTEEEMKDLLKAILENPLFKEKLFQHFVEVSLKKGIAVEAFKKFFDNLDIKEKKSLKIG